jgi:hypothetical protein
MRRKKIVLFLDYGVMVEMLGYVYIYMWQKLKQYGHSTSYM